MSRKSVEEAINAWVRKTPRLVAVPSLDTESLAQYAKSGEELMSLLAAKPNRSPTETLCASTIQSSCRELRRRFLEMHAECVYDVLTEGYTKHKHLHQLVFDAAESFPGLVPTLSQIAEERARVQADKEGYEIDQGLFFQAVLHSTKAAMHLVDSARQPTARSLELIGQFRLSTKVDLGSVSIERRGSAAYLTVSNCYCLNAEDDDLVEDMETAVDLALLDDNIRVGVLRGGMMTHPRYVGRRVFSAGINLKALRDGKISFVDFLLRRELGYINKIARGLSLSDQTANICRAKSTNKTLEKPWIACVDSFAIGGGAQLLLVFDRVIAASDSYFSLPASQEGIVPGFANLRLTKFLGGRMARQLLLFGRKISAREPDARLLFDEVVDSADLDSAIERSILQLGNPAAIANRHMLLLAEEPLEEFLQYASEFAAVQAERLYSCDVIDKVSLPIGSTSAR